MKLAHARGIFLGVWEKIEGVWENLENSGKNF
jgi:hypothetical protein